MFLKITSHLGTQLGRLATTRSNIFPAPFSLYRGSASVSPTMAIAADKREVRKAVQQALKKLTETEMAAESEAIAKHVINAKFFQQAKNLAIYVHCAKLREVDTTAILENAMHHTGAKIYVPRVQDKDANMHFLLINSLAELREVPPYGIREPPPAYTNGTNREDVLDAASPLDIVVMPGLAFNTKGQRLGRGGGYYDKFISSCKHLAEEKGWSPPLLVALSYETQIIDSVPVEENDENVDIIVTQHGLMACTERGQNTLLSA